MQWLQHRHPPDPLDHDKVKTAKIPTSITAISPKHMRKITASSINLVF